MKTMVSQAGETRSHLAPQVDKRRKTKPEEEHTSRSTDLVIGRDVAKFLWNVANTFDDGIETLAWVDNDRVA